jgi:hypothetical protein
MAYGMRVWGADGALQLDENSFTIRVVLSQVVSFGIERGVQSFSVPGCTPDNANAVVIPIGNYGSNDRQFEVLVGNGVVEVANWMRNSPAIFNTASGSMRLIVMRFK